MLPRFHIKDILTVGHYLGLLIIVTGVLMLVPFAVGIAFGEYSAVADYLYGMGICLFVGFLLRLLPPSRLDRRRSLLLCGVAWIVVAVFGAIPLYYGGQFNSFADAIFDAMSALTTTGVSVSLDIDSLSYAEVTWRAVMSLAGAQIIIVVAMYLGFFGAGGYSARENARARHDSTLHSLGLTGRYVLMIAGLIVLAGTIVVTVMFLTKGSSFGDALMNGFWLASSAYSTGSFIPHTSSLIAYHDVWLNAFLAMLMVLGALNFSIYAMIIRGKQNLMTRNSETRTFALWITVLVVAVSFIQCRTGIYESLTGLFNNGTYMIIAGATTSGMQTVYPEQLSKSFSSGVFMLFMAAMFVGSSSSSTGGGVKIFRILQLFRWFWYSIKRALLPDNVSAIIRYNHFGNKRMNASDAQLAMVITVLYVLAAALGAVCFIAHGYDALESICESISYISNSGMTTGITSCDLSTDLKVLALFLMWAGRLEFIALIAVVVGLVISFKRVPNVTPSGVTNTRRSQRKERLRSRLTHLRKSVFGKHSGGGAAGLGAVLVAGLLAASLCLSPVAQAVEGGAEVSADDLPQLDLSVKYREYSVDALVSATERLDGSYVTFTATVMGTSPSGDADHVWLNVKQDGKMIGVLASTQLAQEVTNYGGYKNTGDVVEIYGQFNLACPEHSGELEVHANSLKVVSQGTVTEHPVDYRHLTMGLVLSSLGFMIGFMELVLRGRRHYKRLL